MSYPQGYPWHFTDECCSAFEALKKAFTTALVLTHWIPDTQITVETDTSDYALTAVLSITTSNGKLHPIAFHSWTFSAPELNYDVHDKELLAIFEAFKQWDIILKALDFQSTWSPITGTCNIFQQPKSSHVDKHVGPNTSLDSNLFPSWKTRNQTRCTH